MLTAELPNGQRIMLRVVDIDVHVHEDPQQLASYCDLPWRKALEDMRVDPMRYIDVPGLSSTSQVDPIFPGGIAARMVKEPPQLLIDLEQMGIDIAVIFPDHLLLLGTLPNRDYASAVARAYNRWLVERWLHDGEGRLKGALIAAPQDPIDSAQQIESAGRIPHIAAVCLPCAGVDPLLGDRRYDPIYQAAATVGLPVVLHSASIVHPVFPFNLHGFDNATARHCLSHPFSLMSHLVSMLSSGVPARFPELRIVFTEAGLTWVPFLTWRLDRSFAQRRRDMPLLAQPPSYYVKGFGFGTQPLEESTDADALVALMRLCTGQMMYASDWPHHDFDHPSKVMRLPLTVDEKRLIMGENAASCFRLGGC